MAEQTVSYSIESNSAENDRETGSFLKKDVPGNLPKNAAVPSGRCRRYRRQIGLCIGIIAVLVILACTIPPVVLRNKETQMVVEKYKDEACNKSSKCNGTLDCLNGTCQYHWNGKDCNISIVEPAAQNKTCIYKSHPKFLTQLDEDPFGEACSNVSEKCQTGKSNQQCKSCDNGTKFPAYCFCDKKIHCKTTGSSKPHDHPTKTDCSSCINAFFNYTDFTDRGNCTCSGNPGVVQCKCNDGYSGFMCSAVKIRVCEISDKKLPKLDCKQSNEENCFLKTDGKKLTCNALKESHQINISKEPKCVLP